MTTTTMLTQAQQMGLGHCCSPQNTLKNYSHVFTKRPTRAALTFRPIPQLESASRRVPACAALNDQQEQLQTKSRSDKLEASDNSNSIQQDESSSGDSSQGGLSRLLVLGGLVAAAAAIITAAGGVDGLKDKVHVGIPP